MELLNRGSCCVLVCKLALLGSASSGGRAEVSAGSSTVLRDCLLTEVFSLIVGLVLVVLFHGWGHAARLRQAPSWEVLFVGGVCRGFRDVSSWADLHRGGHMQFQAVRLATVTSVTESVHSGFLELRLVFRLILSSARVLLKRCGGHPRFGANLGGADSLFSL